jgi:hypothetical protein
MDFKELRQWFFEVVGILIPGGIGIFLALAFASDPTAFGLKHPIAEYYVRILQPFSSQLLNYSLVFSVTFASGHFIQQLSVYLLRLHAQMFGLRHQNLIDQVFGSDVVRNYLVPPESTLSATGVHLTANDYFMMVYPDLAGKTKRETFISIAAFCGAMAVVTLSGACLLVVSRVLQIWADTHASTASLTAAVLGGALLTEVWIGRCRYFHDLADRVVVNYFLLQFGSQFRKPLLLGVQPTPEKHE